MCISFFKNLNLEYKHFFVIFNFFLFVGHNQIDKEKDDKSNQWFGATVATSGENGLVVVRIKLFF